MESMSAKETARLIEWLRAQGFTAEQACECIKYIAGETKPN